MLARVLHGKVHLPSVRAPTERLALARQARWGRDLTRAGHHHAGDRLLCRQVRERRQLGHTEQERPVPKPPFTELSRRTENTTTAQENPCPVVRRERPEN